MTIIATSINTFKRKPIQTNHKRKRNFKSGISFRTDSLLNNVESIINVTCYGWMRWNGELEQEIKNRNISGTSATASIVKNLDSMQWKIDKTSSHVNSHKSLLLPTTHSANIINCENGRKVKSTISFCYFLRSPLILLGKSTVCPSLHLLLRWTVQNWDFAVFSVVVVTVAVAGRWTSFVTLFLIYFKIFIGEEESDLIWQFYNQNIHNHSSLDL